MRERERRGSQLVSEWERSRERQGREKRDIERGREEREIEREREKRKESERWRERRREASVRES
eukprot:1342903-Amorphochlora_amoeboformis.AAC.1